MDRWKKKKGFSQSDPLVPQHNLDHAVGKLDVSFLCVIQLVALLVIHLLKCFLMDCSLNKLWMPYPLRIYITVCFRAEARHFSVQDNTLYLAALLLAPCGLQSVSTWAEGSSGSEYQPQGKLLQPPCMAACLSAPVVLLLRCSLCCLHLEININGHCFCCLKGTTFAPYVKRFGQWPEAGA